MPFSVLLLSFNESMNLPACLSSISWCDDVVVMDSYSTDDSVKIAEAAGARVFRREWDHFAGQRNWALDNIEFKHPWVFHLDADERFTDALRAECEKVIARDEHSGYMVPSRMMLGGTWLKWSGLYPSYQMRLGKLGEIRFEQVGHGQRETEAKRGIGTLQEPYLHYGFSKGLDDWLARHEKYAVQEAEETLKELREGSIDWGGLLSLSDPVRRRRALKHLSFRLPFRPTARFLYMSFVRLGFLDGWAGLKYCRLLARYERMIVRNIRRLRNRPEREY